MTRAPDRGSARVARVRQAVAAAGLHALVASHPSNVLLLSGYWPVLGASFAIATRDGPVGIALPEGEEPLAAAGWSTETVTFPMGSLDALRPVADAASEALRRLAGALDLGAARVGFESGPAVEPSSYAATHAYGASLPQFLTGALPDATLVPADPLFTELRARKTPEELERIGAACDIAGRAFAEGSARIRAGLTEEEAAGLLLPLLAQSTAAGRRVERAGGFTWCMSGPNGSRAYLAFARSTDRRLARGDLVLVHCNSYADGYWTDITRTYVLGAPSAGQREMYDAVLAARSAALEAIRPGARAADVDGAARRTLASRGFGAGFRHGTGHEVGFGAVAHTAPPRLHPTSPDVLEAGMVFNVEPAIYIDDVAGLRHCDVVAVTEAGARVLTPFHPHAADLTLPG